MLCGLFGFRGRNRKKGERGPFAECQGREKGITTRRDTWLRSNFLVPKGISRRRGDREKEEGKPEPFKKRIREGRRQKHCQGSCFPLSKDWHTKAMCKRLVEKKKDQKQGEKLTGEKRQ